MTYDTIENAFLFVSSAAPFECTAVVHRKTAETFYASLMAGYDELPDDLDESDDYIGIPHKSDLDLGKPLVMEFVRSGCPEEIDRVLTIFSRRGAYGRFKDLWSRRPCWTSGTSSNNSGPARPYCFGAKKTASSWNDAMRCL